MSGENLGGDPAPSRQSPRRWRERLNGRLERRRDVLTIGQALGQIGPDQHLQYLLYQVPRQTLVHLGIVGLRSGGTHWMHRSAPITSSSGCDAVSYHMGRHKRTGRRAFGRHHYRCLLELLPGELSRGKWKRRAMNLILKAWHLAVIGVLLWIAAIALWLGAQDVLWPVSAPAQILGACFIIAGLATLTGFVLVAARALPFSRKWATGEPQATLIAGGAAAGLYTTLTIVVHSFRYEQAKSWLYGILAASCLILTIQILPRAWNGISNFVKGAGVGLAVLGSVAGFYFQSFYLPENTKVGLQYGISIGQVVQRGGDGVVSVDLTIENDSSVSALMLGSMVVVSGLTLHENSAVVSSTGTQQNLTNYAQDLVTPPSSPIAPDANIRSDELQENTILSIMQPITNSSYLFPSDTLSRNFDVVIPGITKNKIVALEFEIYTLYARTTRLTLGTRFRPIMADFPFYAHDVQSSWSINQSALVRFTRGAQVLYSNWCADLAAPSVGWDVQGAAGVHNSVYAEKAIKADIDVEHSSRNNIFVLP
jgi:hypothetical protein